MRLCPICSEREITKPNLGMCNVCYAQEYGAKIAQAQQSAENKTIRETVMRREALKKEVAAGLLTVAKQAQGPLRTLLERAAMIANGDDPLLHVEAGSDLAVMQSGVQRMKDEMRQQDAPLTILHGGVE